jgi:cobalamin biosynthesis Mg chelatase CobN
MNDSDQKNNSDKENELSKVDNSKELSNFSIENSSISLEGMTDQQIAEVKKRQADAAINIQEKAAKAVIDTRSIDERIQNIADGVNKATEGNAAATLTGTYTDDLGRTEVIMGNTERAQKGKLTQSQQGTSNNGILYVVIVALAVIVIVFMLSN